MSLAHRLRDALRSSANRSPTLLEGDVMEAADAGETTPAAVLIAIVDRPEPTVILTERPKTMRKHPGQISFPGGRIDPGDPGPVAAALREAQEEIGLAPERVEIIGIADRYVTITGFEVVPVLGVIPPDLPLAPNPDEVASLFEAPLRHLLDPRRHEVRSGEWRGLERSYFEIAWEDRRIWGATAAMLVNLSRRLELVG